VRLRRWPGELSLYLTLLLSENRELSITNFRLPQFASSATLLRSRFLRQRPRVLHLVFNGCFRGRERTDETPSHGFRRFSCPVGRSLFTGTFELRCGANLYGFCLAWISDHQWAAGPFEPKQSPIHMVSGYTLRLSVLPNAAIPAHPACGPQPPRSPSISTTRDVLDL